MWNCIPVADGEELMPPKGSIKWQLGSPIAERLFFNERFMHVVHKPNGPV